jgi:hypothetical protein
MAQPRPSNATSATRSLASSSWSVIDISSPQVGFESAK